MPNNRQGHKSIYNVNRSPLGSLLINNHLDLHLHMNKKSSDLSRPIPACPASSTPDN